MGVEKVRFESAHKDKKILQGEIVFPSQTGKGKDKASIYTGVCVCAHAYAPLGGSINDPVVQDLAKSFSNSPLRIPTLIYSSRSPTSWTSVPEQNDYIGAIYEIIRWWREYDEENRGKCPDFIFLAGYSYGAIISSSIQKNLPNVLKIIAQSCSIEIPKKIGVEYIWISPPLSFVAWGLSLGKSQIKAPPPKETIEVFLDENINDNDNDNNNDYNNDHNNDEYSNDNNDDNTCIINYNTLLLYGDRDSFTGPPSYQSLVKKSDNLIHSETIQGASHFWESKSHRDQLMNKVIKWSSDRINMTNDIIHTNTL